MTNINVCLACDDAYSIYAGVVIASILKNAKETEDITIYLLDGGISEKRKQEIESLKEIKKCDIKFISVDESLYSEYKNIPTLEHISFAAFYRLRLPSMLPDVHRIIYLDCDMVVVSSLKELFETDIGDAWIAGCEDIGAKKILTKYKGYVNAGMLLFDLDKMRENNAEQLFLEYTKANANSLKHSDQDIINYSLKGHIYLLDERWNVQSSNFTNRSSYTRNPKIIHFIAKRKPWKWASFSYHRDSYFKYLQLTPWKLSDKEFKHWTKDNQIASLIEYVKYRPLFMLRPRFYKALFLTYILPVLECIFSIKDFSEERYILRLFGIKIKIQKREYNKKLKENPYYYYKKNKIDITTLPKATGQTRLLQLANLESLKELDYVCKQHNLKYWLDFGTLIGAIRHKGFIPWDDDIDTGMLRCDYVKFIDIFNNATRNPDLYAEHDDGLIRIKNKKSPFFYLDIFPYDFYPENLPIKQRYEKSKFLIKISKQIKNKYEKGDYATLHDKVEECIKKYNLRNTENTDYEKYPIIYGIEVNHLHKNWFTDYDTIFPLKKIEFEGCEFSCMNKPEEYLSKAYGDWMGYPKKISMGHSMHKNIPDTDLNILKEIANIQD